MDNRIYKTEDYSKFKKLLGIGTGIWVNKMLKIVTLILIAALAAAYLTAREE